MEFSGTGADEVARIFLSPDADLSTIPHESAHIFLRELEAVAADTDNAVQRQALARQLVENGVAPDALQGVVDGTVSVDEARKLMANLMRELEYAEQNISLVKDVRAQRQKQTNTAQQQGAISPEQELARQQEEENEQTTLDNERRNVRQLRQRARALQGFLRHVDGVQQARRDVQLLRKWAGVAEVGALGSYEYQALQENTARGFEQYLYEGKAPNNELQGVFARMKNWLKAMYANIKEYVAGTQGLKLNADVRRVFDRMLATERAIAADTTVQDALGAEDKFALAAGEILPIEELDRLDRMRQQVEADVQSAMDKRALNKRKARWRARYEAAKESLQADPFWQMVDGIKRRKIERPLHGGMAETEIVGGLNRDSVRELLGAAQYKDFAAVRDDLLRSDGIPVDQAAMGFGYEDADAFIVMLYDRLVAQRETLDKQARALADKGLADEDAQIDPDEGLLAGDSYGDYLQAVEDALLRKMQKAGFRTRKQHVAALKIKGQQAALSDLRSALEKDEYRRQARAQLQGMRLRDIQPQRFSAALRGALTRRNKGLLSKDEYAALKAVQDARMAYALAAEARVIRQDVDKALALVKRVRNINRGI